MAIPMQRAHFVAALAAAILLAGCPVDTADTTRAAYAFADVDGNGICDTCGQGEDWDGDGTCDNFVDEDGDGVCDNRQSHAGLGLGANGYQFMDTGGDGLCDLCGGQNGSGDGVCDSFVDADGDGECDGQYSHWQHGNNNGQGGNDGGGQHS